ncbi:MAG: hypothetical protein ACK5OB_06805 [Pirellula sp.]
MIDRPMLRFAVLCIGWCTAWNGWLTNAASVWGQAPQSHRLAADEGTSLSPRSAPKAWPHTAEVGSFRFYSTLPIERFRSQIDHLVSLPEEISTQLGVELRIPTIYVVVLADQREFEAYLRDHYPGVKQSQAMFIRDRGAGLVLTWMQEHWLIDSRHEVVHAILHAQNVSIPLWLDEGLAEYFEHGGPGPEHPVHLAPLRAQLKFGRVADLELQEKWRSEMPLTGEQYRDAWGSVAFLMHHSSALREEFLAYVSDLMADRATGFLSYRIRRAVPRWRDAYVKYYQGASGNNPQARQLASTALSNADPESAIPTTAPLSAATPPMQR